MDGFNINDNRTRWFHYLVLSILVNVVFINAISIDSHALNIPEPALLKIKLVSFKATELAIVEKIIPEKNTPKIKTKEILTEIKAKKEIKKQEILKKPVPQKVEVVKKVPVIEKKNKPEEKPKTPEKTVEDKIVKKETSLPLMANSFKENNNKTNTTTNIQEARYRKQTPPIYPRRALELGQQGNVILHALVKPDGFPSELKIKDSSGHSLLDKAALAAVRKWEFEPVNKDGISIASWVRVPIEFVIQ
jgi:protein TonB